MKREYVTDEHFKNLPVIRIQKVVLDQFKSVEHGEIVFDCGRHPIPYGTRSDILGIYGQNGSGKTSLIEALGILRYILMGQKIPPQYTECIRAGAGIAYAGMEFTFDLQYPDGKVRKAVYSCRLGVQEDTEADDTVGLVGADGGASSDRRAPRIFDEKLGISGDIDGKKVRMSTVIDTTALDPFGPAVKLRAFIGDDAQSRHDLEIARGIAAEKSLSFIFYKRTVDIFKKSGLYSVYFQVLLELHLFGTFHLHVIDTKSTGFIRLNFMLPIYTRHGLVLLDTSKPSPISEGRYETLKEDVSEINTVLQQLVPGMSVGLKTVSPTILKDGKKGEFIELVSLRDGVEMPIRYESDGVRKIISELELIINAYNDESATIAIDEFDAGVFEYLLGQILQIFEESGRGQIIFTSHNLRPLEVIDKKFLYFTTTNPKNRYIQLKSIGNTNNLRRTYFREIVLGGQQDEEIYRATEKSRIVEALNRVVDVEGE